MNLNLATWGHRDVAKVWVFGLATLCVVALAIFAPVASAANTQPIQVFFLPLPEDQIRTSLYAISTATGMTMHSITGVSVTANGTVIYYDQWENGYELDIANPTQTNTQIWGDGIAANGCPPNINGTPLTCTNGNDVLAAGNVIILENDVPLPRNPATVLYDGRDKLGATKAIAVTRSAWATTPGTVLADAVEAYDTTRWGTSFRLPVGQNLSSSYMFEYTSLLVMASQDSTTVQIDKDGNGTVDDTQTLNQGQAYQVSGGMSSNATVVASKPVQVNLITGDVGSSYESRWFSIPPTDQWGASYYTAVGTTVTTYPANVFIYNPDQASAITVNYQTKAGSGSFSVAAKGTYRYEMPLQSGAHFWTSSGAVFLAVGTMDSSTTGANQTYDWGYTLVPDNWLTTAFAVGWAPGTGDTPISGNGSPVWVTAVRPTTIYVKYDGNVASGPNTAPNGLKYDVSYALGSFESKQVYDPDKNQTGMRVYTADGVLITGAWGEDPAKASAGTPYMDVGYTIPPLPQVVVSKEGGLRLDVGGNGQVDPGDTVAYTITVKNTGAVTLFGTVVSETLPLNTSYVTDSTTLNGIPVADSGLTRFPLDEGGINVGTLAVGNTAVITYGLRLNDFPPVYTAITNTAEVWASEGLFTVTVTTPVNTGNITACSLDFVNSGGTPVTVYLENGTVYVQVNDNDQNTDAGSAQTVRVTVQNQNTGDRETVTLTETGANTGVFRGSLPASVTGGVGIEDGTLNAVAGHTIRADFTDPVYGDSCSDTATITAPSQSKVLYLSDPSQSLDRVDPAATGDATTALSAVLSPGGGGWLYKKQLTFSNGSRSSNLVDFPVLVHLTSSNFDFTKAQSNGQDIRFYDSNEMTALSYQIEYWSSGGQEAFIWVKVPQVDASSNSDNIWMYYGNSGASDAQNATAVWSANYAAVWHLNEASGTLYDSTSGNWDGSPTSVTQGITGAVDGAVNINNVGSISLPNGCIIPSSSTTWTWETWMYIDTLQDYDRVFTQNSGGCAALQLIAYTDSRVGEQGIDVGWATGGSLASPLASAPVSAGSWAHVTWTRNGSTNTMYVNGASASKSSTTSNVGMANGSYIGARSTGSNFSGRLDEMRLSTVVRSADWISAQYASMTGSFVTFGSQQFIGGGASAIFTQTLAMASNFAMPAGGPITVTTYISGSLGSDGTKAVTATLRYNGATFATLTNGTYNSSAGTVVWTGNLGSNTTVPAGQAVSLTVTSGVTNTFQIRYDSATYPSKIQLPTNTVIDVTALGVYDAAYPGGTLLTGGTNGQTVYVRVTASDPFGPTDILSTTLALAGPLGTTNVTLTSTHVVATSGATKTYEYPWATPSTSGAYTITATSYEGYEGITDAASTPFNLSFQDTGTPCSLDFITASGVPTTTFSLGARVYLKCSDLDQNANSGVAESITVTLTTSNGDLEVLTLTETGVNTGVFSGSVTSSNVASPVLGNANLEAPAGTTINAEYRDPDSPADICTDSAMISAVTPAMSLAKTRVEPADGVAVVGELVRFDVVVGNPGPTTLVTATITDTFPSSCLAYQSASVTPSSVVTPTLVWNNVGPIPSGGSTTLSLYFAATAACNPATNSVSGSARDQNNVLVTTGPATASVVTTQPQLALSKTLISGTPVVSNTLTYRINITNTGSTTITSLPLQDNYSASCIEYQSATPAASGAGGGIALWSNLGPLAASASTSVDVVFHVEGPCSPAVNTAVVDNAVDVNGDPVPPVQGSASVITTAQPPQMAVLKTLASPPAGTAYIGDAITYTVRISNTGPNAITSLALTDTYNSACQTAVSYGGFTPTQTGAGLIVWNTLIPPQPPLLPGQAMTLTLGFQATAVNASCVNTATITGLDRYGQAVGPLNSQATVIVGERPRIGVAKALVGNVGSIGSGRYVVTYTLKVQNYGDVVLSSVQVTDDLSITFPNPITFTVNSVTATAGLTPNAGYNGSSNLNLLSGTNSLAVGASGSITFTVTITPGLAGPGPFDNQARAQGTGPLGATVYDLSQNGANPDPDSNNDPTDNNVPTPLTLAQVYGHIFVDTDGGGSQNGLEPNLGGISVVITDSQGITRTVTTDASGNYTATVPAGNTIADIVEATLPAGYVQTAGSNPSTVSATAGVSTNIGADGYQPRGVVYGHIFVDTDGNGVQGGGEPNLSGVSVVITDSLGITRTVTTDASGNYTSTVPAGNTTADVVEATLPAGYVQTAGSDPSSVNVPSGSLTSVGNDGYQPQGVVYGHIFADMDGNGSQDGGEPNLSGISVVITDSLGVTRTVTTDASGNYTATVPAGNTTADIVEATLPAGYVQTAGADPSSVNVPSGSVTSIGVDGYQPRGVVYGHIFVDTNGDGVQGGGEPNLSGVSVVITDSLGITRTVTTDASGNYTATVPAGNTLSDVVEATLPAGYVQTAGSDPSSVNVPSGSLTSVGNDGYQPQGVVYGHIFADMDGNGSQDGGEPNLSGISVVITDSLGVTRTVTTDASGNYTATVPAGNTTADIVEATLPAGYVQTAGADPSSVNVPSGSVTSIGVDGYQPPGALIVDVFDDLNSNGVHDPGEGLPGVDVVITPSVGAPFTITTDADGLYTVTVPAGSAQVDVNDAQLPSGAVQTVGSDPSTVSVPAGGAASDINGYWAHAVIAGGVYDDLNANKQLNGGEPGLAGVLITLSNGMTTTTDASGLYTFTVPAGTYVITETNPTNYASTAALTGTVGSQVVSWDTIRVTVSVGQSSQANDFLDSQDSDGDFVPDPIDPRVTAYDPMGYFYDETTAQILAGGQITVTGPGAVNLILNGATGRYEFFTDGTAGVYTITVTSPPGYTPSTTCLAQDPPPFDPTGKGNPVILGYSEDISHTGYLTSTACTAFYTTFDLTTPGDPYVLNNNFPFKPLPLGVIAGVTFADTLVQNGERDPGENVMIPSVPMSITGLTTGGASVNITATTSITGYYQVDNLLPGVYTVTAQSPYQGWTDTTGTQVVTLTVPAPERLDVNFGYVSPTAVQLADFTAIAGSAAVQLTWRLTLWGQAAPALDVWRAAMGGGWKRLTAAPVGPAAGDPETAAYVFFDTAVEPGATYLYRLVSTAGESFGPWTVRMPAADEVRRFLPLVGR